MVPFEGPVTFGGFMGSNWEMVSYNNGHGLRGRRGVHRISFGIGVGVGIGDDAGDCHHTRELPCDSVEGWGLA